MTREIALVPKFPPRYLCWYSEQIDATQLCCALDKYGIKAEIREPYQNDAYSKRYRAEQWGFSVWICNGFDYGRAVEFKRGLFASLSVKGDPGAFADGVLTGALMRGRPGAKPMLQTPKRLALTA
jgi:hypothetical protein